MSYFSTTPNLPCKKANMKKPRKSNRLWLELQGYTPVRNFVKGA